MSVYRSKENSRGGFTLIELLVVIAIITILATLAVPNVARYIERSRYAKAIAEINSADLGVKGMLTDAGITRFRDLLSPANQTLIDNHWLSIRDSLDADNFAVAAGDAADLRALSTRLLYDLLRQGRNADPVDFNTANLAKLGTSYMELLLDPWQEQYQFVIGPFGGQAPVFLRSYRIGTTVDVAGEQVYRPYTYDGNTRLAINNILPGNPPEDNGSENLTTSIRVLFNLAAAVSPVTGINVGDVDIQEVDVAGNPTGQGLFAFGHPAPRDIPVYIFSTGFNEEVDADLFAQLSVVGPDLEFLGGGDDPNNWDTTAGWESTPK